MTQRQGAVEDRAPGEDGPTWLLEAYVLPVEPRSTYGLYILGGDPEAQSFADITCVFLPY